MLELRVPSDEDLVVVVDRQQKRASGPAGWGILRSDQEFLDPETAAAVARWASGGDGQPPPSPFATRRDSEPQSAKLTAFSATRRAMAIYPDRVTVCGIELWCDRGVPDLREALLLLAQKEDGGYVRMKGPALMEKLGRDPSNPIGRPIKDFCDKATELLAQHRGLACGRYDVIDSRGGYHLTNWIEATVADDEAHEAHGTEDRHEPHHEPHEPDREPHEPHADVLKKTLSALPPDQSERLLKVCHSLASKSLRKEEIRRLSGVSRAQNTRDLKALSDFQLVLKGGPQRQRIYRLAAHAVSLIRKEP